MTEELKNIVTYDKTTGVIIGQGMVYIPNEFPEGKTVKDMKFLDSNEELEVIDNLIDLNLYDRIQLPITDPVVFIEKQPKVETVEDTLAMLRQDRDRILESTDWTQNADSPLSDSKKAEWATYRQALRDLPNTYDKDLKRIEIEFPEPPE
tara:strand:+ start:2101 stop:2550 length:450 start_codon:yes stop_codon:yes gene_type:complete